MTGATLSLLLLFSLGLASARPAGYPTARPAASYLPPKPTPPSNSYGPPKKPNGKPPAPPAPPKKTYGPPVKPTSAPPAPPRDSYGPPPNKPKPNYLPPSDGAGNGQSGGSGGQDIPIIKQEYKINTDGSYKYEYETGNGIKAEQMGSLKDGGAEHPVVLAVEGSFSYSSPEGETISLTYTADENGFQPQGDHLPTPPPIPIEIQEALDKLAAGGGCHGCDDNESGGGDTSGGYSYRRK